MAYSITRRRLQEDKPRFVGFYKEAPQTTVCKDCKQAKCACKKKPMPMPMPAKKAAKPKAKKKKY